MARALKWRPGMRVALLLGFVIACADEEPAPTPQPIECPAQAEACGVRDGGWEARCSYGAVEIVDLTQTLYCAPGQTEVLCESPIGGPTIVEYCGNGCSDVVTYLETLDEYQRFDPSTLCL